MYEQYQDNYDQINVFPEGKRFRISYDSSVNMMRVVSKTRDDLEDIRLAFSTENKSAFFSQQYGYKADQRLYNVNKFGYFYGGLFFRIVNWIRKQYGTANVIAISQQTAQYVHDFLKPLKNGMDALNQNDSVIANISDDTGRNMELRRNNMIEYQMRDYQKDAIRNLIYKNYGRGLIEIPTAGGKSYILANFIWNIMKFFDKNLKFLILVPNVQLVEQFYKDLLDYGYDMRDIAKFEGGMSKADKKINDVSKAKIIISNRQYLFKNKNKIPDIDALICDECHQTLAQSTQEYIVRSSAKIKIGCSGTIPKDKYQLNQLIGMFGEIAHKETISDLQKEGYISKLNITLIDVTDMHVEQNKDLLFHTRSTKKYIADDPDNCDIRFDDAVKAEHEYFTKWYKDLYKPMLDHVSKLDGNTLILFDKLDIGKSLFEFYCESYSDKNVFYTDGSTKIALREDVRQEFEKNDGNILFANVQIMSTGTNIKRLHNIVFAFNSKSTVRVVQSIGRSLRLYKDKESANLIDCCFNFKYSQRHYNERLKMYKELYKKNKPDKIISVIV